MYVIRTYIIGFAKLYFIGMILSCTAGMFAGTYMYFTDHPVAQEIKKQMETK